MRIRTQLLLAFFLLAVVPLAGIVCFSFLDSQRTIRRVAAAETAELSRVMEERMTRVRERFRARVRELPWAEVLRLADDEPRSEAMDRLLAGQLGEMAPALESLTFEPRPAPRPPAPPEPGAAPPGPWPGPEPDPRPRPEPNRGAESPTRVRIVMPEQAARELKADQRILLWEASRHRAAASEAIVRLQKLNLEDLGLENLEDLDLENLGLKDLGLENLEDLDLESLGLEDLEGLAGLKVLESIKVIERLEDLEDSRSEGSGVDGPGRRNPRAPRPGRAAEQAVDEIEIEIAAGEDEAPPPAADRAPSSGPRAAPGSPPSEAWREAQRQRRRAMAEYRRSRNAEAARRSRLVFGESMGVEVWDGERMLGALRPEINAERLLQDLFSQTPLEEGEIPFAVDAEGRVYSNTDQSREVLGRLGIAEDASPGTRWRQGDWLIAVSPDESTGLRFGVARPMGEAMRELRSAAVRNLGLGLFLISLAVFGILPVSQRISSGVREVAEGAERLARGDLETRLPVRGAGELADLSRSFNSMVHDLRDQRERL
ncbi:MAG: HAMP domain-containing protein, partial [Acidobacteriota bacterium]